MWRLWWFHTNMKRPAPFPGAPVDPGDPTKHLLNWGHVALEVRTWSKLRLLAEVARARGDPGGWSLELPQGGGHVWMIFWLQEVDDVQG